MLLNSLHHAESEVMRLTGAWRAGPRLTVVGTPADLPFNAVPDDARGMFHKGKVWLVASTQSPSDLADAVNHEAVAHFGLRQLYGQHWRSFMHAVIKGVRAGDAELLEMHHHVRRSYANADGTFPLSPIREADEISAAVAETWTKGDSGRITTKFPLRSCAKAAWGFFAREQLFMDQPVSGEELQGALLAAQHKIRHGDAFFGIGFRLRRWYAGGMAKPWNPHNPPMSIAESERMLKSERDSDGTWENVKFFFMMIPIWLLLGVFIFGLVGAVVVVVRFLG